MTRVVHLVTSLGHGGAQRMLAKLLAASDRRRFPARVVALVDGGHVRGELEALGVEVTTLGMRPGLPDPRALLRLCRLLRAWRPDLLQTWLYHADLLGLVAGRLAGVPHIVWSVRGTEQGDRAAKPARAAVLATLARLSSVPDAVLANCRSGIAFHEALGYRPRRWELVPNGFPLDVLRPDAADRRAVRAELGVAPHEVAVGTFARWHPNKDWPGLARALARVVPGRPRLRVLLGGSGIDAANAELAAALEAAGVRHRVQLLGAQRDLPRLLRGLDVLVSPSLYEGFPNVVGEAMATAVPVVATDAGDTAWLVGDAGSVVPAGDPAALAAALARIVDLPASGRERLGAAARARIEGDFSLDAVVERFEALWSELAEAAACAA